MAEDRPEIINEAKGVTVLKYGETFIKMQFVSVEESPDPDKITKIDLNNLIAEIITCPVLLNRWGNILSEVDRKLKVDKLNFEIQCAKLRKEIRSDVAAGGEKKPTVVELEDRLLEKPLYKVLSMKVIDSERDKEIANSIFWALKSKVDMLEKLSLTINKDDISSMSPTIIHGIKVIPKTVE